MPKSEENTQELNKLLELMRKEANVEEDDVESDEEDEGRSRSDYESEQKYKSFLQGFLARYDEKSGKKKKNASSKKTDAVFTAEDFEPDEPETSEPDEPETEPEEPVAKAGPDRSKDEIHKSASAHLRELREQRKAGGSGQRPEKVPEPVSVDEDDDDDDRAPWEDAPEVRSVPVRASGREPAIEPAEKAARKPAAEEPVKNPPISELVRDKMSEEVRNKVFGQPSEGGREETRQPVYARSPESKPEETEPESAGAALEEIPEETLAEETPVSETVTDEITDKIPEEVMDAVQDEVPEESPAEPETAPEAAEDGKTPEDVMDAVQDEVSENVSDEG
ncbi:MAG: hypothetical protein IKS35_03145, partial [Clostridia bacterium]|nr:hypothetical protein [Clostridia bacterium]